MDMDKIIKQLEASQIKMEEIKSQLSTLNGNSPGNNSNIPHSSLEKTEDLFNVVFEGKPLPGIPLENAIDALARLSRKKPEDITQFFNKLPWILKRKVSKEIALKYYKALQNAGLACHITKLGSPLVTDETKKPSDFVSPPPVNDKVPCSKCGAMIFPSTSERTGGLCMTCYKSSPNYKPPPKKKVKDTPKDKIVGNITVITMIIGIVAGIVNYVLQFSEMWKDAGMIMTLVAFPLFPSGGALVGFIIGFIIGWFVYLIISPFIPKTKK